MEIWFVRHGATKWSHKKKIHGCKNVPLSCKGFKDVALLADKLSRINFAEVYSSPLLRAYQTAHAISNQKVVIDSMLAERCFGLYEGVNKSKLNIVYSDRVPEGETFYEFVNRISKFLMNVFSKHIEDDRILVVSHGGVFRAMLYEFFGISPDSNCYKLSNSSIAIFRITDRVELVVDGEAILSSN